MDIQKKPTNIFLIILDSARKDCFGCYGNKENLTPNIDRLAEDSLLCNNFYSGGAGTAQSHGFCYFFGAEILFFFVVSFFSLLLLMIRAVLFGIFLSKIFKLPIA